MRKHPFVKSSLVLMLSICSTLITDAQAGRRDQEQRPRLENERLPRGEANRRTNARLIEEIRSRLVTLPFYDVFDWLEGEVNADGTVVTLRGQVVRPTTRTGAENRVRDIEGVVRVNNEIETLPVSPNDDRLRVALYRAIYGFESPLFRYATRAVPPIHIIVSRGRAILKGVVATESDRTLAYTFARSVPGLFEVTNELQVEESDAR